MNSLSLERINATASYRVEATSEAGFYQFFTDGGVHYSVGFIEDDALLSKDAYQLIIANLNNHKSPRDRKVRDTIVSIVDEFFRMNNAALLYLCATGDNKQRMRSRLFEYWFSTYNRKALFTLAQERGCNKIALGHHMDDILQTMLMNLTYQGAFSTMPPLLQMRKFPLTIIRPLCLVHEADIVALASLRGWPAQQKRCPYENESGRTAIREVLRQLEELNPEARYSLWGAMGNVQEELLPRTVKS